MTVYRHTNHGIRPNTTPYNRYYSTKYLAGPSRYITSARLPSLGVHPTLNLREVMNMFRLKSTGFLPQVTLTISVPHFWHACVH